MQPTITLPKTFKLKTHLVFTTIEIKKVGILRTGYVAKFKAGKDENHLIEQIATSITLKSCLELVSKFLDCQIDERHYIIK